jgi:hypothetical protein
MNLWSSESDLEITGLSPVAVNTFPTSSHTATHCRAHCRTQTAVRTAAHRLPCALPHTTAHTAAHCRIQLPHCRTLPHYRTLLHTAVRTVTHYSCLHWMSHTATFGTLSPTLEPVVGSYFGYQSLSARVSVSVSVLTPSFFLVSFTEFWGTLRNNWSEIRTRVNGLLISRNSLSRVSSKKYDDDALQTYSSMANVITYSDVPEYFVPIDTQFRTASDCQELGVSFVRRLRYVHE